MDNLKDCVSNVVRSNHQYILCQIHDRGTSYNAYIAAQKEIMEAIQLVRNEYSSKKFGKPFEKLNDEERMTVLNEIPISICEIEAKKSSR